MEERFYLRGRDELGRLARRGPPISAFALALAPAGIALILLRVLFDEVIFVVVIPVSFVLLLFLFMLPLALLRDRIRNAHVAVKDGAIVLRGNWPDIRVPAENIALISLSPVRLADRVGRGGWPPWNATLFALDHLGTTTLRLELGKAVRYRWWPLVQYRTVLIDPEDRRGFLDALGQVAPHVTIDEALVQ